MSKARKRRTRKHRRSLKAALRHGWGAKPRHKAKTGRTGSIFYKRLQSRGSHKSERFPHVKEARMKARKPAKMTHDIADIRALFE